MAIGALAGLPIKPIHAGAVSHDAASNSAYAADPTGAWKGLNPTEGENPPGMDNGGYGFQPWDFGGGYHNPAQSPYGKLNHFIDGVDFPPRSANHLGSPAFGLTNAGTTPAAGFFGYTARATRIFNSPLAVGQTLAIDFDNPLPQPLDPFAPSGFLFRLNKGGGPVIDDAPLPGVVERFGVFTTSNFNNGRWYTTDSVAFTDTGVAPSATASGSVFKFTLTGLETYTAEFRRLSDGQLLFARSGTLNNAGGGPIDSIEITMFNNGTSSTGAREFFFNNLRIEGVDSVLPGDYNSNGEVDAADYVVWRRNETANNPLPNDNGLTSQAARYELWRSNFGNMTGSGLMSNATVPEPSSLGTACVALGLLLARRFTGRRYGVHANSCNGNTC